jgi:hypothetical protein
MKKVVFLVLSILLSVTYSAYAYNEKALIDSLTKAVKNHPEVGVIKITDIRYNDTVVRLYTNEVLNRASFTPAELDSLRALVSRVVLSKNSDDIFIYSEGIELGELITSLHRSRPDSCKYTLPEGTAWVSNESAAYETEQGLDGKHIALWGSHGRFYNQQQQTWQWQRAKLWTTVEDVYTSSYTMPFLVPMLENAGAVVVQPRERDIQEHEQIVDDSEATVTRHAFVASKEKGWATPTEPLTEKENPFKMGTYSIANTHAKGEIRYTPSLPDGEYAVYVSYQSVNGSTTKAKYIVKHKGQKTEFLVNQRMGGGTWVYLGTFAFDNNAENNYVVLESSGKSGEIVTADAVKFGGGMGSVGRYPHPDAVANTPSSKTVKMDKSKGNANANKILAETSGMARYLEGARYWLQYAGIPDSIYIYTDGRNDYTDDYSCRGKWVNHLSGGSSANPNQYGLRVPLHLSMAFHTDAGTRYNNTIVGSLVIYTDFDNDKNKNFPTGVTRQVNRDLGDYMQTQIVNDMRALWEPKWSRRQLQNSSYAESRHPKVPSVLLELLSHQNFADMQYGLDPRVRFVISRSIYKSMLRFIHEQYNTEYVVQPLPVRDMRMSRKHDDITVEWNPTKDKLEPTAEPTYYVVYTRTNDGDWDNGVRVDTAKYTFKAEHGVRYDIQVRAGNKGGVSMPSEVLSAYIAPNEKGKVLILNGFTRVSGPEWFEDKTYAGIKPYSHGVGYGKDIAFIGEQYDYTIKNKWINDDECGWGSCFSDQQAMFTVGNTFDYPVAHGKVWAENGYSYITANAYAIDSIKGFDAVDLILGKQKAYKLGKDVSFHCFTNGLQKLITTYLKSNGRLIVSGAHIGSDMTSDKGKTFIKKQLHYTYRCDHASKQGSVTVNNNLGTTGKYAFNTTPNQKRIHTENPDCIMPADGAVCVGRYSDTNMSAGVAYDGSKQRKGKTLCWAFMLESSEDFAKLLNSSIEWLMKK